MNGMVKVKDILPLVKWNDVRLVLGEEDEICLLRKDFIAETLSDIIQVGYFKLSHGKRVFKMAPFHHHLEMGGWTGRKWKEKEIFVLFAGITLVMAVVSLLGVTGRYSF